jgi:hypothetical protein
MVMVETTKHRRGNKAVNGDNKHQPTVSEETGLLDQNKIRLDIITAGRAAMIGRKAFHITTCYS